MFVELFGIDATQRLFRRHIKKLKDEQIAKKIQGYLDMLPDILHDICPDVTSLINELVFSNCTYCYYFCIIIFQSMLI